MNKENILAAGALLGTVIGAGVFALPFVFAQSGFLTVLFYFILLCPLLILLHLFFGRVILKSRVKRRLPGYAEKYLGKKAKIIVGSATILGAISALLVYLILGGKFLEIIFGGAVSFFAGTLILWFLMSILVYQGIKSIAKVEVFLTAGLLAAVLIIFLFTLPKASFNNLQLFDKQFVFLPFGVLMFSLIGWSALPEVADLLKKKKNFQKIIVVCLLSAALFYFIFGLLISAVSGPLTSQEGFDGLKPFLGVKIIILGAVFGLFTVTSSFLILANYLKNTLTFDYHFPAKIAFGSVCLAPLLLFLFGWRDFVKVIGLAGSLVGLVEGAAIVLIYKQLKFKTESKKNWLFYPIIGFLALGALSQLVYHF